MKTKLTTLGTLLLICLFALGARAAVILQDNFDSYPVSGPNGITNDTTFWLPHSGAGGASGVFVVADATMSAPNALQISQARAQDIHAGLTNSPYFAGTNGLGAPVAALYASFQINMSTLPTSAGYFAHFYNSSSTFHGRIFATVTNGSAGGTFRIGIANNGAAATNVITTDLSLNTVYTIVARYVPSTGISTVWLNPTSETNSAPTIATTATDNVGLDSIVAFALRQNTGEGILDLDNLKVGTAFADVVPGSINPPSIVLQPLDNTTPFAGGTISFKMLAAGDASIAYKWFYNTNTPLLEATNVIGTASNILTLTNLTVDMSGTYDCVVTNNAGTNQTRFAVLLVNSTPIPPVITNQPVATTNNVGETATFSVLAGGSQPLSYQWKYVPSTNGLVTNIVAGATGTNLTLANVSPSLTSNLYFVTITNQFGSTNSAKALLTVNPIPVLTIAQLRAKVDDSFAPTNTTAIFTIQGIVTTWADMTGVANAEFYMQDASGGIVVFWLGASGTTNLPPAGAIVQVTGPLAAFNGLLEIEPVFTNTLHSVTVISTNNPLPKAQPLPFDPNVTGNLATMKAMEAMYFVASNVMLNLSTPNFVSGANDTITNNVTHTNTFTNSVLTVNYTNTAGQTFILFINAQSGLPNNAKYTSPVTIYGVLGYFTAAGFEFTPSRFADIISYINVSNQVSHVVRPGDLQTNTYAENVLRTGETLTTHVSIGDPEGGSVSLSPVTVGLPGSASWSNVTGGQTGTAIFHFTPVAGDAGSNYVVSVGVTSTSGNAFTNSFTVYVPTADEQKIALSEFLANPTTNSSAPNFNPLHRATDTIGVATNDEYIEIANLSGTDVNLFGWGIYNGSGIKVEDFSASGPTLSSSNYFLVYGGDTGEVPNLPGGAQYNENATSHGLSLATSGGTIILRNQNGNIVDRVVYAAGDLSTNGSLSRFPSINSAFAPQPYISTNLTTAGLQYDGSLWNQHFKVPAGVPNVAIGAINGQVIFNFTANTGLASTLWGASTVTGPYSVLFGRQFPVTSGVFTNPAPAAIQFYYITTQ